MGQGSGRRTLDLRSGFQGPVPLPTDGAVALGKSLSLSRPQFPPLQNSGNGLDGLSETLHPDVLHSEWQGGQAAQGPEGITGNSPLRVNKPNAS